MSSRTQKIHVRGLTINTASLNEQDFISLTDISRYKDANRSDYILQNWMRTRSAIEFLGLWEKLHNPNFNPIEFDGFKTQAGLNSFVLTPKQWIAKTNAIGIISKAGRYGGGAYAHIDIAYEFASWISPEFKLYLIKEFQRLKQQESIKLEQGWDVKRILTKLNYKIHTDAIKDHLIPKSLSTTKINVIYASEADVLNMALFGMTASEWRGLNKKKPGNIRDYANVSQLVVLANLESMNAELIRLGIEQGKRLVKLNQIAIAQMRSLISQSGLKKLKQ